MLNVFRGRDLTGKAVLDACAVDAREGSPQGGCISPCSVAAVSPRAPSLMARGDSQTVRCLPVS